MNISAHYFNHGSAYARRGLGLLHSCFSGPKILIIKPHAVCYEVPTFDLQVLLKNIVKKEASCAIYTCNLMLHLLMGVSVIYVCSRGCSSPQFWCYSFQHNITRPLQSVPLLRLINLLLLPSPHPPIWCSALIRKGCCHQTFRESCASPNLLTFLSLLVRPTISGV